MQGDQAEATVFHAMLYGSTPITIENRVRLVSMSRARIGRANGQLAANVSLGNNAVVASGLNESHARRIAVVAANVTASENFVSTCNAIVLLLMHRPLVLA